MSKVKGKCFVLWRDREASNARDILLALRSRGRISAMGVYMLGTRRQMTKMYEVEGARVRTWNPFRGCRYDCIYCEPSFKRQAKRDKQRCDLCYRYLPHFHSERLNATFKPGETVFVCSMGDISFATDNQIVKILAVCLMHPKTTFLVQSKNPTRFAEIQRIAYIPMNVIFGTTIESNRDYPCISKAPPVLARYKAIRSISCGILSKKWFEQKVYVTIEPIMDFDQGILVEWIRNISPEFVYVGYNNYDTTKLHLQEPTLEKTLSLIAELEKHTEVREKTLREAWDE